mmetsp:Transcript_1280/g.3007  ORF Transcript_1280/g.3007 Transcript_1280/m.3007 type:complete len:377 (+) Transcript_1280:667-1797(+)
MRRYDHVRDEDTIFGINVQVRHFGESSDPCKQDLVVKMDRLGVHLRLFSHPEVGSLRTNHHDITDVNLCLLMEPQHPHTVQHMFPLGALEAHWRRDGNQNRHSRLKVQESGPRFVVTPPLLQQHCHLTMEHDQGILLPHMAEAADDDGYDQVCHNDAGHDLKADEEWVRQDGTAPERPISLELSDVLLPTCAPRPVYNKVVHHLMPFLTSRRAQQCHRCHAEGMEISVFSKRPTIGNSAKQTHPYDRVDENHQSQQRGNIQKTRKNARQGCQHDPQELDVPGHPKHPQNPEASKDLRQDPLPVCHNANYDSHVRPDDRDKIKEIPRIFEVRPHVGNQLQNGLNIEDNHKCQGQHLRIVAIHRALGWLVHAEQDSIR